MRSRFILLVVLTGICQGQSEGGSSYSLKPKQKQQQQQQPESPIICMPLVSTDIFSNPYHEDLLSTPYANLREANGFPRDMGGGSTCSTTAGEEGCNFEMSETKATERTTGYAVSMGDIRASTVEVIGTTGRVITNSNEKAVSESITQSMQKSHARTDETQFASAVQNELAKGYEDSHGRQTTEAIENSVAGTVSVEGTISSSTEVDVGIPGIAEGKETVTASITGGASTTVNRGHSSSSSEEQRHSDSIMYTAMKSDTLTTGVQNTDTTTYGLENGRTTTMSETQALAVSTEHSRSVSEMQQKTLEKTENWEYSITYTVSKQYSIKASAGQTFYPICRATVKALSVVYLCFDSSKPRGVGREEQLVHADLVFAKPDNSSIQVCGWASLEDKEEKIVVSNDEYNQARAHVINPSWVFRYGSKRYGNQKAVTVLSRTGSNLNIEATGNLAIYTNTQVTWQTGVEVFKGSEGKGEHVRTRLTEKGHLVVEAQGIFNNSRVPYRKPDEWITIWSSAPVHHNTTIGYKGGSQSGHLLIMDKEGYLNIYDAVGVKTWCNREGCRHRMGYKYPEVYLVPTDFEHSPAPPGVTDPHNTMPVGVSFKANNTLLSENQGCSNILREGEGIRSPNGRFSLLMLPGGDLVFKDGPTTMFASYTQNIQGRVGPYQAVLTEKGQLTVISGQGFIMWFTTNYLGNVSASNYSLHVLDEGRLAIVRGQDLTTGEEAWESWPMRQRSNSTNLYAKFRLISEYCPRNFTTAPPLSPPPPPPPGPPPSVVQPAGKNYTRLEAGNATGDRLYVGDYVVSSDKTTVFGIFPRGVAVAKAGQTDPEPLGGRTVPGLTVVVLGTDGQLRGRLGNGTEVWDAGAITTYRKEGEEVILSFGGDQGDKLQITDSDEFYWPLAPSPHFYWPMLNNGSKLGMDDYLSSVNREWAFGLCVHKGQLMYTFSRPGCVDALTAKSVYESDAKLKQARELLLTTDGQVIGSYDNKNNKPTQFGRWKSDDWGKPKGTGFSLVLTTEKEVILAESGRKHVIFRT